jgi:hypothetical protein
LPDIQCTARDFQTGVAGYDELRAVAREFGGDIVGDAVGEAGPGR